jgi:hypothetical protein
MGHFGSEIQRKILEDLVAEEQCIEPHLLETVSEVAAGDDKNTFLFSRKLAVLGHWNKNSFLRKML